MRHNRLSDVAGVSHVGRRRRRNEDAIAWDSELGLALVADGVGGNNAGDVASTTAARSIKTDLRAALCSVTGADTGSPEGRGALVGELVRRANHRIRDAAAREADMRGMSTTLALVLLGDDFATVAHLGDSRVYRLHDGRLERLTQDHYATAQLIGAGAMAEQDAARSPLRNVLSRALGMSYDQPPDMRHHPVAAGDVFLLCSDGLTTTIGDRELERMVGEGAGDLRGTAQRAVDLANARGGRDNISVVLMRIA